MVLDSPENLIRLRDDFAGFNANCSNANRLNIDWQITQILDCLATSIMRKLASGIEVVLNE